LYIFLFFQYLKRHNPILSIYRVSREELTKLRESVPYVKIYWYNPKHLYLSWTVTEIMARDKCCLLWDSTHCTSQLTALSLSSLWVFSFYALISR
jgi:hypothetical protein